MKVIVDTSVWSLALRRSKDIENEYVEELEELIKEVRAQLIGPVRQDLLNGIRSEKQYKVLKKHLGAFKQPSTITRLGKMASGVRILTFYYVLSLLAIGCPYLLQITTSSTFNLLFQ